MGRGLSDLQKRILTAAIEGRAKAVKEKPGDGIGGFDVTLRVPIEPEAVASYFEALARYRRWVKEPHRMRIELRREETNDGEAVPDWKHDNGYLWHDDTMIVLRCGLHEAVDSIDRKCLHIKWALPDRLSHGEGWPDLDGSPAYVCTYDFDTRAEAEAFRDEHAPAIGELPGATLTVDERHLASWPDLLVKDAVLLAGDGERSNSAEAVASRAIARLERRGLVATGRARSYRSWFPRALWLTGPGLTLAGSLAPDVAGRIDELRRQHAEAQAADEARRRAEREAWWASPEGQASQAEAEKAMEEIQSLLAGMGITPEAHEAFCESQGASS
jgi:hypothetical protein